MEVGEIAYRSDCTIEWKITDFRKIVLDRLSKIVDSFHSPKFEAMDTTWMLEIVPDRKFFDGCIRLHSYLLKFKSMSKDNIWFKLTFKKSDGAEFAVYSGSFNRRKSKCICRENMLIEQRTLKLNDTVIICCVLQNQKEQTSETESCEGTEKHKEKDSAEKEGYKDDEKKIFQGTMDFERLSQDFRDLLLSGEDSDITIKVNDAEFHVHKLILSARSPVFASMFKHDMKEKNKGVVDICDITADAFHDFLLYLYTGKLEEIFKENVFDLYLAADKYDVKQLKSACVNFMATNLCVDTFCDVLLIALLHEESALLETVSEFFKKNLKKIIVTVKWQTFLKENPTAANELLIKALNHETPDSIL